METNKVEFYRETANEYIFLFPKGKECVYKKHHTDWYMRMALSKADKVTKDRDSLTSDVILAYRDAIREGFNHQLDENINEGSEPNHLDTVVGIREYTKKIQARSEQARAEAERF